MKIVVVRHGRTMSNDLNEAGIHLYTGALDNKYTDLTAEGKQAAKLLADNKYIKSIKRVYCSDLKRAIETAQLAKPGYELHIDKNLRERNLGLFQGKNTQDLLESKEFSKYITDSPYNKFRTDFIQKAPEGENYTDVSNRCKNFLNSIDLKSNDTIGIFSHMHTIRCLFLNMLKIEPKEEVFEFKIKNCEPYVFEGDNINNLKLISHDIEDLIPKN